MGRTEYIVNYVRKNICRYELRLNKNKDLELIEHLNNQPSINGYLRQLIETDIKKGSN
jgi:hypothetical protein